MRTDEPTGEHIWPYRFEIRLETYRRRGDLPPDTPNLSFDLWLFEDPDENRKLLNRYSGRHPYTDVDQRSAFRADATREEVRKWVETQRTVLAELGWIAAETERGLESGGGLPAVRLCRELMTAVAEEHRTEADRLMAAIRDTNWPRSYAPWTEQARHRREVHERNSRYGGGYSSG